MKTGKKIYFASDFHLGVPTYAKSREREDAIVRWLDSIKDTTEELFLVGDLFDFWFEYSKVVPKGFIRLLGKIASFTDAGIPVHVFTGNHDLWMFDYLEKEISVTIHHQPIEREFNGKKFLIGHGDGLGPGDESYKLLKKVFESKICQWLFARIHPNLALTLANKWSKNSRVSNENKENFLGVDKEWLAQYSLQMLQKKHFDFFVFGHRHLPLDIKLSEDSRYINLGEWLNYNSYATFDGNHLTLSYFEKSKPTIQ